MVALLFTHLLMHIFIGATIASATTGNATISAAYSTMMTARTTLTTPDLPPAEDRHHARQPRHRRRCSERCAAALVTAVVHWSWWLLIDDAEREESEPPWMSLLGMLPGSPLPVAAASPSLVPPAVPSKE